MWGSEVTGQTGHERRQHTTGTNGNMVPVTPACPGCDQLQASVLALLQQRGAASSTGASLCQLDSDTATSGWNAHAPTLSQSETGAQRNSATESCPGQGCLQGEGVCSFISIPNPLIFLFKSGLEHRDPLLFESSRYATSLLRKTHVSTCFH